MTSTKDSASRASKITKKDAITVPTRSRADTLVKMMIFMITEERLGASTTGAVGDTEAEQHKQQHLMKLISTLKSHPRPKRKMRMLNFLLQLTSSKCQSHPRTNSKSTLRQ